MLEMILRSIDPSNEFLKIDTRIQPNISRLFLDDIDVVLIHNPTAMSNESIKDLDQFLKEGGGVLWFQGNKINRNILRLVKKTKGVIDIVYNPLETDLLKEAEKHNIKSIGGLIMLVEQAKPSFEIWSKKDIEIDDKIYRSLISKI